MSVNSVSLDVLMNLHLASTLFMTGLIWFVQVVHYPLFAQVGAKAFVPYARLHQGLTTRVVLLPMLLELVTGVWLWPVVEPSDRVAVGGGLVLLVLIWASTALLQVPRHKKLVSRRDLNVVKSLVRTNWIRTLGWSLRSVLVLSFTL